MNLDSYILDDNNNVVATDFMTAMQWNKKYPERRYVACTEKGDIKVSTVLIGADMNYANWSPIPIVFESMVFGKDQEGGRDELECDRCGTYEEAQRLHAKFVAKYIDKTKVIEKRTTTLSIKITMPEITFAERKEMTPCIAKTLKVGDRVGWYGQTAPFSKNGRREGKVIAVIQPGATPRALRSEFKNKYEQGNIGNAGVPRNVISYVIAVEQEGKLARLYWPRPELLEHLS